MNDEAPLPRGSPQNEVLQAWAAEEVPNGREDRLEAVRRIGVWEAAATAAQLNLTSLSLTVLPPGFPALLQRLDVSNNQLTYLPESLPTGLQELYARSNRLTSLPHTFPPGLRRLDVAHNRLTSLSGLPSGLQRLDLSDNRLTSLPDTLPPRLYILHVDQNQLTHLPAALPDTLWRLDVSDNRLTHLPDSFPASLITLHASGNRLTSLPENLLTELRHASVVSLRRNPLSERVQTNLATAMHAEGYEGPLVSYSFSTAGGTTQGSVRPLGEAVADWLKDEPETLALWQSFGRERGAQDYARFLDKLRQTVNYGDEAFQDAVRDDLRKAARSPRLRGQYFLLAFDAISTCQDRITLTWNGMQTARLNVEVEDGDFDENLQGILERGRILFRLDVLERIAREKVRSLSFVDEVEVYLAYQVKLRDALELQPVAPKMRFERFSYVTEADIALAETSVREQEAAGFADFLATRWEPWQAVLKRFAPEDHAAMKTRLAEAMEEEFSARLNQRLKEHGLIGDADAERELGRQVNDEIAREIMRPTTNQFLAQRGLSL
ncbi:NEL-type E3 ubiquitin ligase domain-containing protein [Bradyrhizobium glycinis]|uniref:NEL-type E3 ubiquitin ligase domain-containing protein n=1 Tax=Bradyrhizobium glycinis TaxID=2751812 RepID=UPI0018D81488|nr:NEL-type E3 ubiquitin ligase domain-containing protein [Bradyrhizobium glycinis]MBH5372761.1 leucine-rich repeat domain-containing protein [Bradyrhizobium glycinis]